jgi:hypothetical protein
VKAHAPGQLPTAGFAGKSHQSESEFDGTVLLPGPAPCEHPPSLPEANRTRPMHLAYRLRSSREAQGNVLSLGLGPLRLGPTGKPSTGPA